MNEKPRPTRDLNHLTTEELERERLKCRITASRHSWFYLIQPYLILLATALVSGYLIPRITREWQDQQKELEVKTKLVSEVSDTVTRFIVAIQKVEVAEIRKARYDSEKFDSAFEAWEIGLSGISAQLSAYFPRSSMSEDWNEYAKIVNEGYALTHTIVPEYRIQRIEKIRKFFPDEQIDWDALQTPAGQLPSLEAARPYEAAWFSLKTAMLKKKDRLVEKILSSPTEITQR